MTTLANDIYMLALIASFTSGHLLELSLAVLAPGAWVLRGAVYISQIKVTCSIL